jgi:hypothetical protein
MDALSGAPSAPSSTPASRSGPRQEPTHGAPYDDDDEHDTAPPTKPAAPTANSAARESRAVGDRGGAKLRNASPSRAPQNGHAPSPTRT